MLVSDSYQQFSMKKLTNQLIGVCAYMRGIRVFEIAIVVLLRCFRAFDHFHLGNIPEFGLKLANLQHLTAPLVHLAVIDMKYQHED